MQNLSAYVASNLLHFPDATVKALQKDEIELDSVPRASFTTGKTGLAWLACGPHLEVINSVTGERLSAYCFSGVTEQPPTVVAVREFSWQKKTGLLVAVVEAEGSVLCLYDIGNSRVVKAVVLPGSVTAVEPIINQGGANAITQHLHQSLRWFFGVAAVVTDVGHILLIDLCLDDVSTNQDELDTSDLEIMSGLPADVPKLREAARIVHRHLCLQLLAPSGTTISALCYVSRTNQLVVGFSDGCLSLWNMKSLRREFHGQIEGGKVPISTFAFQEPESDPRNCCYLWAVQANQSGEEVSLHLLQLAFGNRKCSSSGHIVYEHLEYCEERYSLDLSSSFLSLRSHTKSTKLLSCQTIEKFHTHSEREDELPEVTSPDASVAVFSWQVHTYGHGKPSMYMAVFDINRWYQAQMPDSLRSGQFLKNCSYFAFWSLEAVLNVTEENIFDVLVHERSFGRGVPTFYPPPEQFYYPSTYSFDATCLLQSGVLHVACLGFQKETLHFLKNSGFSLNETIPAGYSKCLVAGLLSPRLADVQPSSLSEEEQLRALLSAAVETSSIGLLTHCIKQWTAKEQPRSAANLRFVMDWTWNKVVVLKKDFDRICIPLFDGSCNFIDTQTLQALQHCQMHISNLTTVLNCFITEAHELTKQGLVDLKTKQSITRILEQYTAVVIWFCRCGLLPDYLDDMQLNRPYFNYSLMQQYYSDRRKKLNFLSRDKWNTNSLMIDSFVCQLGEKAEQLWKRDEGTGKYPPASLHALLDLYLLENADEMSKHAITIYFLLDIMYSSPDKPNSAIESFPTAFSVPCGLVKLIQGFWLLDHNDYQNSVDCILHPAANRVMTWQHNQIIETLMCQGVHRQALRYIQAIKPVALTCEEVKLHITVLLTNKNLIEAWNLQKLNSTRLHVEELLKHIYETCQEKGLIEDLLKLTFEDSEQRHLHNFLQTSGCLQNQELLLVNHLHRASYIPALQLNQSLKGYHMNDSDRRLRERAMARNSILDHYSKVLPRVQRNLASERAKPYTLSSTIWKEVTRPKPLSTVAKQAPLGNLITKASFISNVLMKVKEVSTASENMELSTYKSLNPEEQNPINISAVLEGPDAFLGTTRSRNVARLLDSVVHPVLAQSPLIHQDIECISEESPYRASRLLTFSPVQPNVQKIAQIKNLAKASEFNLLETPSIVKRAKALASNTISSIFVADTPQSILRSSARTTFLASPSISPERSDIPPLLPRVSKISFMEEITTKSAKTILAPDQGMPGSSLVQKSQDTVWIERIALLTDHSSSEIDLTAMQDGMRIKAESCRETSSVSGRLDQTTLSYEDASTPEYFEAGIDSTQMEFQTQLNKDTLIPVVDSLIAAKPQQIVTEVLELQERGIISINDSKDISSTHPEHQNEVNEDIDLTEDKAMLNEISAQFPHSLKDESFKENNVAESNLKTCINWYTTEDFHLKCDDANTGHPYKFELSAGRGPVNDDAKIENAVAPSNFTLFLDEEEDDSTDITTIETIHPVSEKLKSSSEVSSTFSKEHVNHKNKIADAVSTNTCVLDCEHKEDILETIPYVLQPGSVAIERNLLNEFKETRSKNLPNEVTIESAFKNVLTMVRNVDTSSRIPAQKGICTENIIEKCIQADIIPENSTQKVNDVETGFLQKEVKSVLVIPQSPQRSIRKAAEVPENSNEVENIPSVRRRGKKILENSESSDSKPQEKQLSSQILRTTRSSVHEKAQDTKEKFFPSRTRRGKRPILSEDMLDPNVISVPPTRLTRSSKIMQETEERSSNQNTAIDENKQVAMPSRRRKHAVNELVKHFEHNASLVSVKEEISLPISRKWSRIKTENQIDSRIARDEQKQSQEQRTPVPRKMVRRSTIAKVAKVIPKATEQSHKEQAEEGVLTKLTDKVNLSTVRQTRSTLLSVSEENVDKSMQDLQLKVGEDAVSNVPNTKKQSKKARLTTTQTSKTLPDNSTNAFVFTTPTTKYRRNAKAIKVQHLTSPDAVQSAVSSQYLFSPPSIRTRRTTKNINAVSEKEQALKVPEAENTEAKVPKVLVVKQQRGRPPKQKAKKKGKSTDKPAWSPPAVEIQLLSPPESPVVDSAAAKTTSPETNVLDKKSIRRNRKIVPSKAITHRKIR